MKTIESSEFFVAGGRIRCQQCTATAKRSGVRCGRPALKLSRTQKCQFHGGRGSGPKTAQGRHRISIANTVHGFETRALRQERSRKSRELDQLEDAMRLLKMVTGPKTPGRKAAGYVQLKTMDEVRQFLIAHALNQPRGPDKDG